MPSLARIVALTHRGRVRAGNEDTIVVGAWVSPPDMEAPRAFQHPVNGPLLCAVCDGMGGHRAGEVASRHVAQRLAAEQSRLIDADAVAAVLDAIDDELYQAMLADADLRGMGTTVVGVVLAARLVWFNIGDSRLYRVEPKGLTQLSIDDTPEGPRSGAITQSLGGAAVRKIILPHLGEEDLVLPARFLLCSDGLTDMLADADIADCLALPDVDAVPQLFELAMRAGGVDNISVVLVSVTAA